MKHGWPVVACAMAAGLLTAAAEKPLVVVWSEGTAPTNVYPNDINGAIAEGLRASLPEWEIVTAGLDQPSQGLPDALLKRAAVLIWWGHKKHGAVADDLTARIDARVKDGGMGFIALHSAHFAKPNKKIMGTPCSWGAYKGDTTTLQIRVKDPAHPIAKGVAADFTVENAERYSDPYAVPPAEAIVFDGVATMKAGGTEVSQQGFCWTVGKGRFFYFQAGHETNPIYFDKNVRTIMANAVRWAAAR